jgi:hypothetical protein
MNSIKSTCPPLTPGDILTLRGQPVTKLVNPNNRKNALDLEEWVYYNMPDKTKECYRFNNGILVNYRVEEAV